MGRYTEFDFFRDVCYETDKGLKRREVIINPVEATTKPIRPRKLSENEKHHPGRQTGKK